MNMDELLAIILPGLQGSINLSLNDQQVGLLIEDFLEDKMSFINSIKSREGYLELNVKLPIIGAKIINVEIVSIDSSSKSLTANLKLLNLNRLLIKGVVALLNKFGAEFNFKDGILAVDLTGYWKELVSDLPKDARKKLNDVKITISSVTNKAVITIKIA